MVETRNKIGIWYWVIAILFLPYGMFVVLMRKKAIPILKGSILAIVFLAISQAFVGLMIFSEGKPLLQHMVLLAFFLFFLFTSKWQYKLGLNKEIWSDVERRYWKIFLFSCYGAVVIASLSLIVNYMLLRGSQT